MLIDGISYDLSKVPKKESLQLAKIGQVYLLSPVTNAIIFYCKLCGINTLDKRNDVEELWFRITYLRRFGFSIYQTANIFEIHFFEPYYNDLYAHQGLEVVVPYVPRKQWINHKIDLFIEYNSRMADNGQNKYALQTLLDSRNEAMPAYIKQETNIDIDSLKISEPEAQKEQPAQNPEKKDEKVVDKKQEEKANPHPAGSPEWFIHEHMIEQLKNNVPENTAPMPQVINPDDEKGNSKSKKSKNEDKSKKNEKTKNPKKHK